MTDFMQDHVEKTLGPHCSQLKGSPTSQKRDPLPSSEEDIHYDHEDQVDPRLREALSGPGTRQGSQK